VRYGSEGHDIGACRYQTLLGLIDFSCARAWVLTPLQKPPTVRALLRQKGTMQRGPPPWLMQRPDDPRDALRQPWRMHRLPPPCCYTQHRERGHQVSTEAPWCWRVGASVFIYRGYM
jgi:hypothetical protein